MKSTLLNNSFNLIAYRCGGGLLNPENSISAILHSIAAYPNTILEIDLQLTKDKNVIAFHDFEIDRTTNKKGFVRDFNIDELKSLELKNKDGSSNKAAKISTLAEIFEMFPNQRYILDLHEKSIELIKKVAEIVENNSQQYKIAIVSIDDNVIKLFRELRPSWTFIASSKETKKFIIASKLGLEKFVSTNSDIYFLPEKLGWLNILSKRSLKELKLRNKTVWTCKNFKTYENVNNLSDKKRFEDLGVGGIYTDDVKSLIE